MLDKKNITEEQLREGTRLFEAFWLRPKQYANKIVPLRLRINNKWGGWKIKDELVDSVGLEVGDTISSEVTPQFMSGLIDYEDDMDLFASGTGADWLLNNNVVVGTIIDCTVRFVYAKAPVGPKGKEISKVSLVFENGISVVGMDREYIDKQKGFPDDIDDLLFRRLLK